MSIQTTLAVTKIITFLTFLVMVCGFFFAVYVFFTGAVHTSPEYEAYKSENKCIAMLVSHGIERKKIVRDNGSCTTVKSYGASSRAK